MPDTSSISICHPSPSRATTIPFYKPVVSQINSYPTRDLTYSPIPSQTISGSKLCPFLTLPTELRLYIYSLIAEPLTTTQKTFSKTNYTPIDTPFPSTKLETHVLRIHKDPNKPGSISPKLLLRTIPLICRTCYYEIRNEVTGPIPLPLRKQTAAINRQERDFAGFTGPSVGEVSSSPQEKYRPEYQPKSPTSPSANDAALKRIFANCVAEFSSEKAIPHFDKQRPRLLRHIRNFRVWGFHGDFSRSEGKKPLVYEILQPEKFVALRRAEFVDGNMDGKGDIREGSGEIFWVCERVEGRHEKKGFEGEEWRDVDLGKKI